MILGGGVSNGFDLLLPAIRSRVAADAMPAFRDIPVLRAELGDDSGLVGAAALAFERDRRPGGRVQPGPSATP